MNTGLTAGFPESLRDRCLPRLVDLTRTAEEED
jgi:hypothetical protein